MYSAEAGKKSVKEVYLDTYVSLPGFITKIWQLFLDAYGTVRVYDCTLFQSPRGGWSRSQHDIGKFFSVIDGRLCHD